MNKITVFRNNAAIEVGILKKDVAVDGIVRDFKLRLESIAAMGDEVMDLPFLTIPGLGLTGCPANSQQAVIDVISRLDNGYVSSGDAFEGFMDFYNIARDKGIRLIITDKDGVLKKGSNMQWGGRFRQLALEMGDGKPFVVILTGSTLQQNIPFMKEYGLDERLKTNPFIRDYPYLMLIENGAIHLNVLTGETRDYIADISPDLLKVLKGEFEPKVREKLEAEVLPFFGFQWSNDYNDQRGRVYHVQDKQTMVSFNVPREFSDGTPYRKTKHSEMYRDRVVSVMEEVLQELGLPYEVAK